MKIRFWGVRAFIPVPLSGQDVRKKIQKVLSYASPRDLVDEESIQGFIDTLPYSTAGNYGSNTSCIEVRSAHDDLIIIDAGSGLRALGNELLKEGYGAGGEECSIIFTDTHWDHLQGLPFFAPLHIEGNVFHIHAIHENIEGRLRYQHNPFFFPVRFDQMPSVKYFYQHDKDEVWEIKNIRISSKAMSRPGTPYSYRFEENAKVFILCSHIESLMLVKERGEMESYINYFQDADLLIFDTQQTIEKQDQELDKRHSASLQAIELALHANVKQLAFFNYDPSYSDEKLDQLLLHSLEHKRAPQMAKRRDINIFLAHEGLEISI